MTKCKGGVPASPSGHSRAEPEEVSGLRPSVPNAAAQALQLVPKSTFDAWGDLDLGAPEEAWACAVDRFREEARINRQCAEQSRKLAEDAAKQAEQHSRRADDFTNLANAIEKAPISFTATADEVGAEESA